MSRGRQSSANAETAIQASVAVFVARFFQLNRFRFHNERNILRQYQVASINVLEVSKLTVTELFSQFLVPISYLSDN